MSKKRIVVLSCDMMHSEVTANKTTEPPNQTHQPLSSGSDAYFRVGLGDCASRKGSILSFFLSLVLKTQVMFLSFRAKMFSRVREGYWRCVCARDMTHSYVWHDLFTVTCLNRIRVPFIRVVWLMHMTCRHCTVLGSVLGTFTQFPIFTTNQTDSTFVQTLQNFDAEISYGKKAWTFAK